MKFVAMTFTFLVFAGTRTGALYLRPSKGEDLPMERILTRVHDGLEFSTLLDPTILALRVVENRSNIGGWTYAVQYMSNSQGIAISPTFCNATDSEQNVVVGFGSNGHTYSALKSPTSSEKSPGGVYSSPYIHSCFLNLKPSTRYNFGVDMSHKTYSITTPPLAGTKSSFEMVIVGDLGQTNYSNATMVAASQYIQENNVSTLLFPGDLSYADGEQTRWDSFAVLAEPLLSSVTTLFTPGNHEIKQGENFVAYQKRYVGEDTNLWFHEKRGSVHFFSLCTYCAREESSPQFIWFQQQIKLVNRTETPWVVVMLHAPFYSSNVDHQGEVTDMRELFEPVFIKHGVDIVFAGHVHSYERSNPVEFFNPTACGVTYLNVGDGGNREEVSNQWYAKPSWSAERESSFGFGSLKILDDNTALWQWFRNPDGFFEFPDQTPFPDSFATFDSFLINRTLCHDGIGN